MKRGEIWRVALDPTVGAEIRKSRPVVILNDDAVGALPLRIAAPLTRWKPEFASVPWMVEMPAGGKNGTVRHSAVDLFQIRSLSTTRFAERLGSVDDKTMDAIEHALRHVLALEGS